MAVAPNDVDPDVRVALEIARRVDDRVVLDRARDEAVALIATWLQGATERKVVGLGATACENDLAGVGVDRGGHLVTGAVHCGTRGPSLGVDAGGVAVRLAEDAAHRLGDLGVHGRGRGVVQIDAVHL